MKQRLITASIAGVIGAGVGVGVAISQKQNDNMIGIAIGCGVVAFLFGLVFKLKAV